MTISTAYNIDHNEIVVMKYNKVVTVYYKIRAYFVKTAKKTETKATITYKSMDYQEKL